VKAVNVQPTHEHEWEAAPGLPAPLPRGERVLWQGAPDWRQLALHAFHVRKIGLYFALMLGVQAAYLLGEGASGGALWRPLSVSVLTASLALGMLAGVAWFAGRTALYTLTDKRVIMRVGIVLTLTFNLPYKRIAAASLRRYGRRSLDIALQLYPQDRIGWFHLWPHQRAWHLSHPQPTLRCLPEGEAVSALLMQQWQRVHAGEAVVTADSAEAAAPAAAPLTAPVRQPARPAPSSRPASEPHQGLPA
jgi:Bacterial PH domain